MGIAEKTMIALGMSTTPFFFINAAMKKIRHFLLGLLDVNYSDRELRRRQREAVEKFWA